MKTNQNNSRREVPNLIHVNSHVYGKDALCYPALEGLPIDQEMKTLAETHRYHPHVFILPPWRAIYHPDAERRQDWKESVFTYNKMIHTHRGYQYDLVEVPRVPVAERADFVLEFIKAH